MIQTFEYNGAKIDFKLENGAILVNLASIKNLFNADFARIGESEIHRLIGRTITESTFRVSYNVKTLSELYHCDQDYIWIHRYLAITICSWLDTNFQIWMLSAIEKASVADIGNKSKVKSSKKDSSFTNEELYTDLISKHFAQGQYESGSINVTCSEIREYIFNRSNILLNIYNVGLVLKKLGFVQQRNAIRRFYNVKILTLNSDPILSLISHIG